MSKEIVALITSVGMDDYLSYTLEKNKDLFKECYVLINQADNTSKKICHKYSATPIEFDQFFDDKSIFNKSGGIRYAQQILHKKYHNDWLLLLDTDIIVDPKILDLDVAGLNCNALYGMKRLDVYTHEDLVNKKYIPYKNPINKKSKQNMVVGYFQMYFDKTKLYQKKSYNAATCDCYFSSLFDNNILLDNMYAIHVGKERSHWNGRNNERLNWSAP